MGDRSLAILQKRSLGGNRRDAVSRNIHRIAALCVQNIEEMNRTFTVSHALVSPDFQNATVFLSVYFGVKQDDSLLEDNHRELKDSIIRKAGLRRLRDVCFKISESYL